MADLLSLKFAEWKAQGQTLRRSRQPIQVVR